MRASASIAAIFAATLFAPVIHRARASENPLGQFDGQTGVGSPKIPGSATYDAANQEYTLTGAGTNMWSTSDQFHFLWKQLKGDFILRARLEFVGTGVNPHRKVGWMLRPSLETDAAYVDGAEHGSGLTSLQYRRAQGAKTEQIELSVTNATIIQIERNGNSFVFSAARAGDPFVTAQLGDVTMPDEVYAGLFICSHEGAAAEKAIFRDVRIIHPAKAGFVPYKDFIGSVLEILDVSNGRLKMIHTSAQPLEAPNWTRDGRALIYNISGRAAGWGRLARFDLATGHASPINTGPANRNNNDHVLSFDGKMLGISDQSAFSDGQSRIFTLPIGGGAPKQITALAPSYLHGWSPDGKLLVYTGRRNGKFDVYKISSDGGDEIKLTNGEGFNDGAEYTPDGKYIYFNSTRTGKMQLWRMKPDGRDPEAVTSDEFNNWFPHISPDGKWIAFLSFSKDVAPTDHPYYHQVYVRLMPIEGGAAKVIAYVYGGQGTMNVPSWSPDSKRLAFVSNSGME